MLRDNFDHLIRAASAITNHKKYLVIGSQAILLDDQYKDMKEIEIYDENFIIFQSQSVDIVLLDDELTENNKIINMILGNDSHFHIRFGYYLKTVDLLNASLFKDWEQRLNFYRYANSVYAYGLSIEDIAISKIISYRKKDIAYLKNLFDYQLINHSKINYIVEKQLRYATKYHDPEMVKLSKLVKKRIPLLTTQ